VLISFQLFKPMRELDVGGLIVSEPLNADAGSVMWGKNDLTLHFAAGRSCVCDPHVFTPVSGSTRQLLPHTNFRPRRVLLYSVATAAVPSVQAAGSDSKDLAARHANPDSQRAVFSSLQQPPEMLFDDSLTRQSQPMAASVQTSLAAAGLSAQHIKDACFACSPAPSAILYRFPPATSLLQVASFLTSKSEGSVCCPVARFTTQGHSTVVAVAEADLQQSSAAALVSSPALWACFAQWLENSKPLYSSYVFALLSTLW
jgi:hypothetical protein